jgi:hypothetical protein
MPRYYAIEESYWLHGRWQNTIVVRDADMDDVVVAVRHSFAAAKAEADARNGRAMPVEVRP